MLHFPAIFCIGILQDKGTLDGQESHDTVVYTCQTSGEEGQMMEVEINRKARMWLESFLAAGMVPVINDQCRFAKSWSRPGGWWPLPRGS